MHFRAVVRMVASNSAKLHVGGKVCSGRNACSCHCSEATQTLARNHSSRWLPVGVSSVAGTRRPKAQTTSTGRWTPQQLYHPARRQTRVPRDGHRSFSTCASWRTEASPLPSLGTLRRRLSPPRRLCSRRRLWPHRRLWTLRCVFC